MTLIFKITDVVRKDIGDFVKECAGKREKKINSCLVARVELSLTTTMKIKLFYYATAKLESTKRFECHPDLSGQIELNAETCFNPFGNRRNGLKNVCDTVPINLSNKYFRIYLLCIRKTIKNFVIYLYKRFC